MFRARNLDLRRNALLAKVQHECADYAIAIHAINRNVRRRHSAEYQDAVTEYEARVERLRILQREGRELAIEELVCEMASETWEAVEEVRRRG